VASIAAVRVYTESERGTLSAVVAVALKSATIRNLQTLGLADAWMRRYGCPVSYDVLLCMTPFCRFAQFRLAVAMRGGRCAWPSAQMRGGQMRN